MASSSAFRCASASASSRKRSSILIRYRFGVRGRSGGGSGAYACMVSRMMSSTCSLNSSTSMYTHRSFNSLKPVTTISASSRNILMAFSMKSTNGLLTILWIFTGRLGSPFISGFSGAPGMSSLGFSGSTGISTPRLSLAPAFVGAFTTLSITAGAFSSTVILFMQSGFFSSTSLFMLSRARRWIDTTSTSVSYFGALGSTTGVSNLPSRRARYSMSMACKLIVMTSCTASSMACGSVAFRMRFDASRSCFRVAGKVINFCT